VRSGLSHGGVRKDNAKVTVMPGLSRSPGIAATNRCMAGMPCDKHTISLVLCPVRLSPVTLTNLSLNVYSQRAAGH
jgi:hypothetical protein